MANVLCQECEEFQDPDQTFLFFHFNLLLPVVRKKKIKVLTQRKGYM